MMGYLNYGMFKSITPGIAIECDIVVALLTAMALYRHRQNIVRLATRTEKKTYLTKKNKETEGEKQA